MCNLLLISSSRVHGTEFLEHCRGAITTHLQGCQSLLFVPYALKEHQQYADLVASALEPIGISVNSIHASTDPVASVQQAEAIFIGGGNTFRLLKTIYDLKLRDPLRDAVLGKGVPYMGSSAGTNMACPTIRTSNDMPIVEPPSFEALNFIPFQINAHFIDADPKSTHKGETREQRIAEFHEENDTPVLGLREGSWLKIENGHCTLDGETGAKLFQPNTSPSELAPGDLSNLI